MIDYLYTYENLEPYRNLRKVTRKKDYEIN